MERNDGKGNSLIMELGNYVEQRSILKKVD